MRKQTKIAALVSAAALLAIGASMTSFAYGWNFDGMEWEWLDRDGNRVTETWKTSGGKYYWLDENGVMATDQLIEDNENYYYVDENGVRVTNQWHSFDNEDGEEVNGVSVGTLWYYFGNTGAAYKHSNATNGEIALKTVSWNGESKKFGFDENGRMVSGWAEINDEYYYFGDEDDGRIHTGWWLLEPADFMSGDHEDQEWFYFSGSGKATRADRYDAKKDKYIKGHYYSFDYDGVLQTDWFSTTTPKDAVLTAASAVYAYADVDGTKTGWVYAEKPDGSGDSEWYYLIKTQGHKTVPFNIGGEKYAARYINGKTYMFDGNGVMFTGVKEFNSDNLIANKTDEGAGHVDTVKKLEDGIYYFSKAAASQGKDGRMLTGKQAYDDDGDIYYYYLKKDGRAVAGQIWDNTLYGANGRRIQADDNTYRVINISDYKDKDEMLEGGVLLGNSATKKATAGTIIVSTTGKVKKNTTVTVDGVRYHVGSDFIVDSAEYKDTKDKADEMFEKVAYDQD